MITLLRSPVALIVAAACLAAPASVFAGSNNAAATSTYLRVDHRYLTEVSAHLPAAKTGTASLVRKLTSECPDVAAQAPAGHDLEAFALESLYAVAVAFERPTRAATSAFVGDIQHLRWSSRKLTKLVHRQAASKRLEATIAAPRLCPELREWAASNYAMLPKSVTAYLQTASAAVSPEEEILTLLGPYASHGTKRLLRSVKGLEARADLKVIEIALPAIKQLQEGLGLLRAVQPAPASS
jgi:hypothetical protein